ncbi:VOC family protein [Aquabacter cavernae]|uniref:VOC family protein n=1 Tax=Aquabacter cavernae TaxID=2496029 RepID=UPI000F8CA661|nr:VOC family protein [Aquabacter cavernae]
MQGTFVWYELMTTDTEAANRFYADAVGWQTRDAGMPGMAYTLLSSGGDDIAGIMELPENARAMGAPPSWIGYVGVDDVDAGAASVAAGGGQVYRAPQDIPGIGRFAIVADPEGAVFALFQGDGEMPPRNPAMRPGLVGWHELLATDPERAFAFYSGQYGWAKDQAIDMGPLGTYQLFTYGGGSEGVGGMMARPPGVPVSFWTYYFTTDDIVFAEARVIAGGGRIINGPMEVPGGVHIFQALDPQGAVFAMVGPKLA